MWERKGTWDRWGRLGGRGMGGRWDIWSNWAKAASICHLICSFQERLASAKSCVWSQLARICR